MSNSLSEKTKEIVCILKAIFGIPVALLGVIGAELFSVSYAVFRRHVLCGKTAHC
jgi:hypothetical protein